LFIGWRKSSQGGLEWCGVESMGSHG
jgi:hypothetical protein